MFSPRKNDFTKQFNYHQITTERKKEQKKWMYLVLLGAFLFQMFPFCIAMNLNNVFAGSDWYKWTDGNTTIIGLTFTIGSLAAIIGPLVAKLFNKKISMRFVYILGISISMFGFSIMGLNAFIPHQQRSLGVVTALLWGGMFIAQSGLLIFSSLGVNNLITKWWPPEKKGIALGIAYTGGSLGNIWLQQLVGVLSKHFGNIVGDNYVLNGTQYATYFILAALGLIVGIIVALFACKRPLPPTEIFSNKTNSPTKIVEKNDSIENGVSFLVTRKYPIYWILTFGFLIMQMGGLFSTTNATFIRNATLLNNPTVNYNSLMANAGTIFGISCLIGNTVGGWLHDKIGPNKSVALGCVLQSIGILSLILSPGNVNLVYIYFLMTGLSVYVFTTTIAYISGRLFGIKQSNNQTAILGIFVALGFAISNSVSGPLMQDTSKIYELFGYKTRGNMIPLFIFAITSCLLGGLLISISSTIIMNKGIKGMIEYNDTKYSRVIFIREWFRIKFNKLRIIVIRKDNRQQVQSERLNFNKTISSINEYVKGLGLNNKQKQVLYIVGFNQLITLSRLINLCDFNPNHVIKSLQTKKLITTEQLLNDVLISLDKKLNRFVNGIEYSKQIKKANNHLSKMLIKLETKNKSKLNNLNKKLAQTNNIAIDNDKQNLQVQKSTKKLNRSNKRFQSKTFSNDWKQYKWEYNKLQTIYEINEISNKLINKKNNKISNLNKKILRTNYIFNHNKKQEIIGHYLLLDYYDNKVNHVNGLINNDIERYYENKINKFKTKNYHNNLKIARIENRQKSIDLIKIN